MKELLLKKANINNENFLSIVEPDDCSLVYSLVKKDLLLTENFVIQSKSGDNVADIKMEHILFTPAKMPKLTLSTKDGKHFIVKKEIEQLCDTINIEGEDLTVKGDLFSEHFELLCKDKCIATFNYNDTNNLVSFDEDYELLVILFVFAIELVK